MQSLLKELNIKLESHPILWCDNMSAIALFENPIFHGRTKHTEIDVHFVREKIGKGEIMPKYVPTKRQVADIMTKALGHELFEFHINKLSIWEKS